MTNIIGSSNPFQTRIQSFDSSPLSQSAASRTLTALPGGALAIDDTFVRRSIVPGQGWMQALGATGGPEAQSAMQAPAAAAPAKKKKKKKGLKKLAKKVKSFAKKGIKTLKSIVKKPLDFVKQTLGTFMNPLQLLGGGGIPKP